MAGAAGTRWFPPVMSRLGRRILLWLSAVAAAFLAAAWWIQQQHLLPSFLELEARQATADLQRGAEALRNELAFVGDYVSDWSGWDDTYRFVEDRNAGFATSNLATGVFRETSFDFLAIVAPDGREVWRGAELAGTAVKVDELPAGRWPLEHELLSPRGTEDVRLGFVVTAHGPLLVASRPVTDSARTAPPRGWIMMGRFLSPARLERLRRQTWLDLAITPMHGSRHAAADWQGDDDRREVRNDHLLVSRRLPGLRGPADDLVVEVAVARALVAQGRRALGFASMATAVAVLLMFAALATMLQRVVVGPLRRLTRHALRIRASGDLTRRSGVSRDDEIGTLAAEFDGMVEQLATLQSQLVERARAGGMAEVARSVLHDVGNALQPVQTDLGLLQRHLGSPYVADLERVGQLLEAHAAELATWLATDARGQQVPAFLGAVAKGLRADREAAARELDHLGRGLGHIRQLIDRQQVDRRAQGAVEIVRTEALLAEAIRMSRGDLADDVPFVTEVSVPTLAVEQHRLLAILINLLRNARQAGLGVPAARRTVHVAVQPAGADRVRITVRDQGVGIAPENLTRIFQSGFSTKRDGHGLGLHGCANSVAELGGRLWAESEGPDRGATFRLELPCVEVPVEAPA